MQMRAARLRSGSITHRAQTGSLTVICGSMFSGKTEELIRLVRRAMHARKKVQVFKSSLDTRCDTTVIRTHDDTRFNAIAVKDTQTLIGLLDPNVQVVGIEEVQFLDEPIVELCMHLADTGIHVVVAGLDQDFRAMPFSFMPRLMALADDVMKLHAICKVCGEEASRTQRLVNGRPASWDEPIILIGADDTYEARCRRCHKVRNKPRSAKARIDNVQARKRIPTTVVAAADAHVNRPENALQNPEHVKASNKEPTAEPDLQLNMFPERTQ